MLFILGELYIIMADSKTFISMRIVDVEKCIWISNDYDRYYSYLNHRVDVISIIGSVTDFEFDDGCIIYRYVYILICIKYVYIVFHVRVDDGTGKCLVQ
jgi:hypothetical protein